MQRRTLLTSAVGAAVAATFSTTAGAVKNRVTGSLPNVIDKNIRIYGNDAYPVPHRRAMEIGAVRARMPHPKDARTIYPAIEKHLNAPLIHKPPLR